MEGLKFDVEEMEMEYRKKSRKKLVITRSTFRLRFKVPWTGWSTMLYVTRPLNVLTMGIANLTQDNRFVPFFDFDNMFLYRVRSEMRQLQREFDLGSLILLASSISYDNQGKEYGNYHCMGVAKLNSLKEHKEMLEVSSVDEHFTRISNTFNGRYWVLRIMPKVDKHGREVVSKPVLREVLTANTNREVSTAHRRLIQGYYHFPELRNCREDNFNWIKLVKYPSTYGKWISDFAVNLPESKALLNRMLKHFNKGGAYADIRQGR